MIVQDVPAEKWLPNSDTVFYVDVVDGSGNPEDCSAFTMEFVVRYASNGQVAMTITGSAITVIAGVAAHSRVAVATTPANNALTPGTFVGALWRTDTGARHPLWQGTMPLSPVPAT